MMKAFSIAFCLLCAGCVSHREAVVAPPIHVTRDTAPSKRTSGESPIASVIANSAFGPETAVGQMMIGCGRFYEQNGRWPHTKDEIAAGLTGANLSPGKLDYVADLRLHEDRASLIIDFVSTENGRAQGTITLTPKNA